MFSLEVPALLHWSPHHRLSRALCPLPAHPHSKWTEDGGGYDQYSEALPNPGLTVQLSSAGPPVAFKPRAVVLVADASGAAGTYMDLHHTNSRLKYYNETLFFTGTLPLFDISTGVTSLSPGAERDASVTITPMVQVGEELTPDPVSVKVYTCSEFAARVPCSYLASPPPPVTVTPAPPAAAMPPTAATGSNAAAGRRMLAVPPLFIPGDDATAGYMWTAAPGFTVPSPVASAAASAAVPLLTLLVLLTTRHTPLLGWGTLWQVVVMSVGGAIATPICFELFGWLDRTLVHPRAGQTSFRSDREIRRGR